MPTAFPISSAVTSADGSMLLVSFTPSPAPSSYLLLDWSANYATATATCNGKRLAFHSATWKGGVLWVYLFFLSPADRILLTDSGTVALSMDAGFLRDTAGNTTAAVSAYACVNHSMANALGNPDTSNMTFTYTQYVDPVGGSDAVTFGQSQSSATPCKTLRGADQLFNGAVAANTGRKVLVKRGTSADIATASPQGPTYLGTSRSAPLYIGTYGTGAAPVIFNSDANGSGLEHSGGGGTPVNAGYWITHGISFQRDSSVTEPLGFGFHLGHISGAGVQTHDVWVHDCEFVGFMVNVDIDGGIGTIDRVTMTKCKVLDARNTGAGHPVGIGPATSNALFFRDCLIDRCGYKALDYSARDIFSRNVYAIHDCGPICFLDCWCTRSGSEGIQLRPGGGIVGCAFIGCSQYGYNVRGRIADCYGEGADDIDGGNLRGQGFGLYHGSGFDQLDSEAAVLERCIVANAVGGQKVSFDTPSDSGSALTNQPQFIRNCTAFAHGALILSHAASGNYPNPLTINRNILDVNAASYVIAFNNTPSSYASLASDYNVFDFTGVNAAQIAGVNKTLAQWQAATGGDANTITTTTAWGDSSATLGKFNLAAGGSDLSSALITRLRARTLGTWDSTFEPQRAVALMGTYFRTSTHATLDSTLLGLRGANFLLAPSSPSALSDGDSIQFSWTAVSNAVTYRIYHKGASESWILLAETSATSLTTTAVEDINFARVNVADGRFFVLPFTQQNGYIVLGDWAVTNVEAIAAGQGVSIAVAAGLYVTTSGTLSGVTCLGLAGLGGLVQIDLEGASSLFSAYPEIVTQLKSLLPDARIGPWIPFPSSITDGSWDATLAASDVVFVACYQQAVETDTEAQADAARIVAELRTNLAIRGYSDVVVVPNLSLEVGWLHPSYNPADPPLVTVGNLVARRRGVSTVNGTPVIYWVSCNAGMPAREALIDALALSLVTSLEAIQTLEGTYRVTAVDALGFESWYTSSFTAITGNVNVGRTTGQPPPKFIALIDCRDPQLGLAKVDYTHGAVLPLLWEQGWQAFYDYAGIDRLWTDFGVSRFMLYAPFGVYDPSLAKTVGYTPAQAAVTTNLLGPRQAATDLMDGRLVNGLTSGNLPGFSIFWQSIVADFTSQGGEVMCWHGPPPYTMARDGMTLDSWVTEPEACNMSVGFEVAAGIDRLSYDTPTSLLADRLALRLRATYLGQHELMDPRLNGWADGRWQLASDRTRADALWSAPTTYNVPALGKESIVILDRSIVAATRVQLALQWIGRATRGSVWAPAVYVGDLTDSQIVTLVLAGG